MKNIACLLLLLSGCSMQLNAQYSIGSWGGGAPVLSTYSEMMNGKSQQDQATIQIQSNSGSSSTNTDTWRITARLTQDYTSGSYTVGAQYSFLKWNSQNSGGLNALSLSSSLYQLSKYTEVTMYQGLMPISNYGQRQLTINLTIQGGNHLLVVPNATYHSAYEFKLYKIVGGVAQLISTSTQSTGGSARFQIEYAFNNGQSMTLQNGASMFNLQFTNPSDYAAEKSVQVNNALKVSSYSTYNVAVKASGNFTSSGSAQTIPISVLKLQVTTSQAYTGLQIMPPITLTTTDQTVAVRTQTNPQIIEYNLRFYIPQNSSGLAVAPGTYSTHVYFVITPN